MHVNCGERYKDMNDHGTCIHTQSSCSQEPEKNSALNGILTYELCETGAVLFQRSYQTIEEMVPF